MELCGGNSPVDKISVAPIRRAKREIDVSTYLLWYDEYHEYINDNRERHIPGMRKAASSCTTVRHESGHIPGMRKAGHTCVNDIGGITGYLGETEV